MSNSITVWLIITLILGVISNFAVWSRGYTRARMLAIVGFLVSSPIAACSLMFTLGWPVMLIDGVTLEAGDHTLLGTKIVIDDGIYILVDRGMYQPRYYKIPWDASIADKLQKALDEKGEGGEAKITIDPFKFPWEPKEDPNRPKSEDNTGEASFNPFEWSWYTYERKFYADPQPKLLPNKLETPPAYNFQNDI